MKNRTFCRRHPLFAVMMLCLIVCSGVYIISQSREFLSWKPEVARIYPATTTAFFLIVSGGGIYQTGDSGNAPVWARVVGWGIVVPIGVLALPLSVLTDTISLPLDMFRSRQ